MKSKRPVLLITTSLLTVAGLYFGVFRPVSGTNRMTESKPKVPSHATESAGLSTPPAMDGEISSKNPERTESEVTNTGVRENRVGTASPQPAQLDTPTDATDRKDRRLTDAPAEEEAVPETKLPQSPVGIRLAPDVRLPLAAMPNDLNLNPIKQKVLQNIIDEYYQTVAAAVPTSENVEPTGTAIVEENGEPTRVITNSPAVETARQRADSRFKAIFGKAAYMRMTMNTLQESRLPATPVEP